MLYQDERVLLKLRGMAKGLTSRTHLQEDLVQVARIHLSREEELHPDETESWHLQGCLFAMLNYLKQGRSVDSWRHRQGWLPLPDESGSPALPEEFLEQFDSVRSAVAEHDIIAALSPSLTPVEQGVLLDLADGLTVAEIAKKRGLTHQQVTRFRQQGYSVPPARPASSPPPRATA